MAIKSAVIEQSLTENDVINKLQIIHCSCHHHWIVSTTLGYKIGQVKVYDFIRTVMKKQRV